MTTPDAPALDTLRRWEALGAQLEGLTATQVLDPFEEDEVWVTCYAGAQGQAVRTDYSTDLHSVARLERIIREHHPLAVHQRYARALHLIAVQGYVPGNPMAPYTANAAQRLEAVLVALGLVESVWVREKSERAAPEEGAKG